MVNMKLKTGWGDTAETIVWTAAEKKGLSSEADLISADQ